MNALRERIDRRGVRRGGLLRASGTTSLRASGTTSPRASGTTSLRAEGEESA
ncbi:hypothetical protein [Microbispora sp. CSR-4]|uniref:hypothetical protein n=1 Tax=Microbispora sp. CSR-4 TaxID=2592813 RepID=UPI00164FEDFD|nr:hypothetical protein [Microbispora sp. CSR-4]